jgi:hypothetical protein
MASIADYSYRRYLWTTAGIGKLFLMKLAGKQDSPRTRGGTAQICRASPLKYSANRELKILNF